MIKIQAISDTHGKHDEMLIDESCDVLIHAGDSTNYRELYKNEMEFRQFLEWFGNINVKHKILIAGNHDASLTKKYNRELLKERGIVYLEDDYVEIEGFTFCGSPWTPTFGNWHFMKDRNKLHRHFDMLLKEGIDVLITHGPPKNVLDLSYNKNRELEMCGCNGLRKAVEKYKPKHHVFGHCHDNKDIVNFGKMIKGNTTFYNVSAVEDGKFHYPPINNKGQIFEL